MNKKTTLLSVLGLVAVSGAGYLYTTGQGTQVVQQVTSYLPESVRSNLPASVLPTQQEQNVVSNTEHATEEMAQASLMDEESVNNVDNASDESVNNVDSDLLGDIEQSIENPVADVAENTEAVATVEVEPSASQGQPSASQEPEVSNKSQEILALEKQLEEVNNKIANLDTEKTTLEDQFQNVLKKNRSLAVKLKDIDDQLKNNMQ